MDWGAKGTMNYGFDIDAILGMNFLMFAGIIIDTSKMTTCLQSSC